MHNFKELKVWQNARAFVKEIYLSTNTFPAEEKYGLISQMRRSAVSIPSNIAEGSGRRTDKDFVYFLNVSLGSAYELQTLLFLSQDLDLLNNEKTELLNSSLEEIQKMIYGLIKTIKI
ncbi:MAG: four helix bundle protein [Cyclobacteriaceae bacterium]|nr:four helix bundle protein [Cyclobacteriaceae bacterium]